MLTSVILLFLFVSLLFYLIFGGADFGAGIVEATLRGESAEQQRARGMISRAIAPVWEANHVWLILMVVIVFMGFPEVYTTVSVLLHLPLIALLIGIVLRGCAFTFRHYDQWDDRFSRMYGRIFRVSSFWAPFCLGVLAAAVTTQTLTWDAESYYGLYIGPWLHPAGLVTGLFVCSLVAFVASVFLVGESREDPPVRRLFLDRSRWFLGAMLGLGASTFAAAWASGVDLVGAFLDSAVSLGAFAAATLMLLPFWKTLTSDRVNLARGLGAGIVTLVLVGWLGAFFPQAVRFTGDVSLNWYEVAAVPAVQWALLVALLTGSALIFPSLYFLFRTFKS